MKSRKRDYSDQVLEFKKVHKAIEELRLSIRESGKYTGHMKNVLEHLIEYCMIINAL